MALITPKGYCTRGQIQNYLLHGIKDYFIPQIDHWIAQIETFIERQTGRVFIADSEATEKVYDGDGGMSLFIDECVEITKLTIDDVEVSSDNYLLYPASELPKTRIKLTNDSGEIFTTDEQNIKVEAKWGYSVECPADLSFAATILVVGIINFSAEMEGEAKSETIGTYSVTYKDQMDWQNFKSAKEILQKYIKIIL